MRIEKIPNDRKVTHFHSPFEPVQAKRKVFPGVNEELRRMQTEEKCDEDCFIRQIVITRKKDDSIKLALDSKLLSNQIFKNKYQMPNIHELKDNVAILLSETPTEQV